MNPKLTKPEQFCADVWAYMRRERLVEPNPTDYELSPLQGHRLALQCHIEFERQKLQEAFEHYPKKH